MRICNIEIRPDSPEVMDAARVLAIHWEIDDDVAHIALCQWLERTVADLVTDALYYSDHPPFGPAFQAEMQQAQQDKAASAGAWAPSNETPTSAPIGGDRLLAAPTALFLPELDPPPQRIYWADLPLLPRDAEDYLFRLMRGDNVAIDQRHLVEIARALLSNYADFYVVHGPAAGGPVSYTAMLVAPYNVASFRAVSGDYGWTFDLVRDLAKADATEQPELERPEDTVPQLCDRTIGGCGAPLGLLEEREAGLCVNCLAKMER